MGNSFLCDSIYSKETSELEDEVAREQLEKFKLAANFVTLTDRYSYILAENSELKEMVEDLQKQLCKQNNMEHNTPMQHKIQHGTPSRKLPARSQTDAKIPTQSAAALNFFFNYEVGEEIPFGVKMVFVEDKRASIDNVKMTWAIEVTESFDISILNMTVDRIAEDPNSPVVLTMHRFGKRLLITVVPKSDEDCAEIMEKLASFLGEGCRSEEMEFGFKASMEQIMDNPFVFLDGFYFSVDDLYSNSGTVLKNGGLLKFFDGRPDLIPFRCVVEHIMKSFTLGISGDFQFSGNADNLKQVLIDEVLGGNDLPNANVFLKDYDMMNTMLERMKLYPTWPFLKELLKQLEHIRNITQISYNTPFGKAVVTFTGFSNPLKRVDFSRLEFDD